MESQTYILIAILIATAVLSGYLYMKHDRNYGLIAGGIGLASAAAYYYLFPVEKVALQAPEFAGEPEAI